MKTDVQEECREKIKQLLKEYNCTIETDDYCALWLYDRDTYETLGIKNLASE